MVYFLQSPDGGPIKIGTTGDIKTRHYQLELHYKTPLAILATMKGGRPEEAAIHARFAHLRFGRTEQFAPAPDLMEFINRPLFASANPDAVEVMVPVDANYVPIKIEARLAYKIRVIAANKGMTVGQCVTEMMDTIVARDWGKMLREKEGQK